MPLVWEGEKYLSELERRASKQLARASDFLVTQIKTKLSQGQPAGPPGGPPHVFRGMLRNSIDYEMLSPLTSRVGVQIGPANKYALIHELGGTIIPTKAKALAIPIHPSAKKAIGPRAFTDLVMIKRKTGPPLLVRPHSAKRARSFDLMYVLLPSVNIPARPYLRPTLYENEEELTRIIAGDPKQYEME